MASLKRPWRPLCPTTGNNGRLRCHRIVNMLLMGKVMPAVKIECSDGVYKRRDRDVVFARYDRWKYVQEGAMQIDV